MISLAKAKFSTRVINFQTKEWNRKIQLFEHRNPYLTIYRKVGISGSFEFSVKWSIQSNEREKYKLVYISERVRLLVVKLGTILLP